MAVFFLWWCTDVVYIDRRCKSLWRSLILRLGGHLNPYEIAMMETTTGLLGCICKTIQMCRWMFSPGWVWQVGRNESFCCSINLALFLETYCWQEKALFCFASGCDTINPGLFQHVQKKQLHKKSHKSEMLTCEWLWIFMKTHRPN